MLWIAQNSSRIPVQHETAVSQSKQAEGEAGETSSKTETQMVFSGVSRSNKVLDVPVTSGRCLLTTQEVDKLFSKLVWNMRGFLLLKEIISALNFGRQSFRAALEHTITDFKKCAMLI